MRGNKCYVEQPWNGIYQAPERVEPVSGSVAAVHHFGYNKQTRIWCPSSAYLGLRFSLAMPGYECPVLECPVEFAISSGRRKTMARPDQWICVYARLSLLIRTEWHIRASINFLFSDNDRIGFGEDSRGIDRQFLTVSSVYILDISEGRDRSRLRRAKNGSAGRSLAAREGRIVIAV